MTFKSLGLSDALLKAVNKKGLLEPSIIQEKAIPLILEGKDVLASAQTGSRKTAESPAVRYGQIDIKINALVRNDKTTIY